MQDILTAFQSLDRPPIQAIVGMGGVGKSSLAIEIARAAQPDFPDGVLWASVATSEPTAVLESWAAAYGYDFSRIGDLESMANAFRGVLADKQVLIVLDDVSSAARIRPLLPNGADVRVLITTRDQDLAYAVDAEVWLLDELKPENGRALLTNILGEDRINAEPDEATAICDLLQNLPLALEIIGQRLKSRPRRQLADVARRLRDEKQRLSVLQISDREVRASFALSYATLDDSLKEMFALMGVFNGRAFTAKILATIAEQDRYEAEDRIFALVALSLAQEEGDIRYIQHPLLADFAREHLAEGDEREVYGRFARTYLQFARQHQHDYDTLRPEWDNLMAAMAAAHDHELWQTVIDFADALHDAWFARGRYAQARQGYYFSVVATKQLNQKMKLGEIELNWGEACIEQSDFEEAQTHLQTAYQLYENFGDMAGKSKVQSKMARIAMDQGNLMEAEKLLKICMEIHKNLDDELGLAELIEAKARIAYRQREYQYAYKLGQKTLRLYENHDHKIGVLQTLGLLTNSQIELNRKGETDLDEALQYSQRALSLADELQDTGRKAVALYGLSRVHILLRAINQAEEEAKQSLNLLIKIGDRRSEALVLIHLSEIYFYKKDYEAALEVAYSINPLLKSLKAKETEAVNWWNIGHFHRHREELDLAKKAWSNSYQLAKEIQHGALLERLLQL